MSDTRAAAIAAEYPLSAYPSPDLAFSTLVSDANFACPALQVDRWTAARVPTYAYQFNDDNAPLNIAPPGALPPMATHGTELPYLFDQPNAPLPRTSPRPAGARRQHARGLGPLRRDRQPVVARTALAVVHTERNVLSLVPSQPQVETDFAAAHHCSFWAAG